MADLFYIDEDYYYPSQGYHVYVADAVVDLTVYIEEGYIDSDYYLNPNVSSGWSASATIVTGETFEGAAALSVSVSQSATATRIKEFSVAVDNLFSSSITVVAQLAGVALLESQSTMTIAPVVNRSAAITLDNLVNVSSQAQYTADPTIAFSATATQTTNIANVQLAQSSLSAQSSVFSSKYLGSGRPRNLNDNNLTLLFDTSIKKFGSASLYGTGNNVSDIILARNYGSIDIDSEDFAFETWIYRSSTTTHVARSTIGPISAATVSGNTNQVSISYTDNNNSTTTNTYTALNSSAWNHILVIKTSTALAYYVNGSRVANLTPPAGFYQSVGYVSSFSFTPGNATNTNRIDETSFHVGTTLGYNPSQTTITVPTSARTNDSSYTQALYHFNSDLLDDVSTVETALASLSADAAISAQADANTKLASASLSSDTAQTTQVTAVKEATASLSVATTQTTQGIRVRYADSTQSADFTQSTVIGSIKQFAVTVDSLFTSSLDVVAQLAGVALLETTATVTAQAVKTVDSQSTQTAEFAHAAAILYTAGGTSNQSAEFAQSTLGERIRFGVASQTAEFTQSTTANKIPPFSAVLAVTASVSANIDKLKLSASDITAEFAQTAQAAKTTDVESTQSATFAQSADTIRVRFADSAQTVAFAQNTEAVKTVDAISSDSAEFTQTTSAVKTAVATVNNMVLFGSAIDADLTARPLVYLESTASLSALIGVIKQFDTGALFGASLPGDTRYLIYSDNTKLPSSVNQGHYVSFWMRIRSKDSSGTIIESDDPNNTGSLQLSYLPSDIRFTSFAETAPNSQVVWTFTGTRPTDDDWHHFALAITAWDGAFPGTFAARLYVDGTAYTASATGPLTYSHVQSWFNNLRIGQSASIDIAQLWIGDFANLDSNNVGSFLGNFYDGGYIDLGNGQVNGTPYIVYEPYVAPFTARTTASSGSLSDFYGTVPVRGPLVQTDLTASFVGVFLFVWNVDSEFTQTATATRVLAGHADLSATATISATVNGEFGGSSDLTATATIAATISKTTGYQAALAAQADFEVQPGLFELGQADLTDEFDLVADFDAVPPTRAEAALSAEFNITIDAQSFTDATVINLGIFTQVCEATVIPPIRTGADLTATATLSAIIGSIEQFASLVQSSGTVTATASVTRTTSSDLDSEFTESITGQRVRFGTISISALHATVIAGDVINLDPFLTLTIPQETGVLRVKAESRGLIIEEETRSLIIEGWE